MMSDVIDIAMSKKCQYHPFYTFFPNALIELIHIFQGNRWKEEKWFESGRRQDQDGGRSLRRVHQVIMKEYNGES